MHVSICIYIHVFMRTFSLYTHQLIHSFIYLFIRLCVAAVAVPCNFVCGGTRNHVCCVWGTRNCVCAVWLLWLCCAVAEYHKRLTDRMRLKVRIPNMMLLFVCLFVC